ncbi:MAG TPA: MAPEG family protein [Rhizomicrobium sp.]
MSAISAMPLAAIVTILAIILYMMTAVRVGTMRTRHNIVAPAVVGHPEFDRAYRIQMNTLEAMPVFLPALWLATLYFSIRFPAVWWLPAVFGVLWIVGRYIYMQAYAADPGKRSTGFGIAALAQIVLLVLAVVGIVMNWPGLGPA